jgi:predicted ATPase/class 3 adenylate cyclase
VTFSERLAELQLQRHLAVAISLSAAPRVLPAVSRGAIIVRVAQELPSGTVTFLFTDVEGSTRLLDELGAGGYAEALADHRGVLRGVIASHGGVEVDTQGDAFFVAFSRATDAVAAAAEAQQALAAGLVRVRMGIHTGEPMLSDEGYVGMDVHRAARIAAAGHGGQVLVSQTTRDLLYGTELRDLGEHRLKDLTAAQRLYQLGEGEFPALKALYEANLPVQPTALVGRARELAEVGELLRRHRLVTLTGPGGSGKTRLALQAAAERVEDFVDGVWFVSLAAVREPELLESTIAQVLGVMEPQTVAEHFTNKQALVVLDNFEQLLEAGPQLADILGQAPELNLLVTSRASLRLSGEREYPVPSLTDEEALALFVDRARAVKPTFEAPESVAEICRRLDNLPLALELAAARIRSLTPEAMLARLNHRLPLLIGGARDAPERQRTLRATLEWSYDLLETHERDLFVRLAVFAGSFDLEAAESVCGADLDRLEALIEKSLLRQSDSGRFFALETIREFASELLGASAEFALELRRRHRRFFLALAEAEELRARGAHEQQALDRLDGEHANLQAAIASALADERADEALRIVGALHPYWYHRCRFTLGRTLAEQALSASDHEDSLARVKTLGAAAEFALLQGDYHSARAWLEERLDLCRRPECSARLSSTLTLLGHLAIVEGEATEAMRLYQEALEVEESEASADPWFDRSVGLSNLGWAQLKLGALDDAEATLQLGLADARATRSNMQESALLNNLALVALEKKDSRRAADLARQSLKLLRELKNERLVKECLEILACEAADRDSLIRAARLAGAADALRQALEMTPGLEDVPDHGRLEAARASLDHAWAQAWEEGLAMAGDAAIDYALAGTEDARPVDPVA